MDFNDEAPLFSLEGIRTTAKVIDCYDGDTITCVFQPGDLSTKQFRWKCRLVGIDTPEIRSRSAEEKEKGIKARDYLRDLILNENVELECSKFDKYGRVLVTVIKDEEDINEKLVTDGHAKEFMRGKK